jgi:anti-anti-sigma regulatory factor
VFDLAQPEYFTSSGAQLFLFAAKRPSSAKRKSVLCSLKGHVRFDLSGF